MIGIISLFNNINKFMSGLGGIRQKVRLMGQELQSIHHLKEDCVEKLKQFEKGKKETQKHKMIMKLNKKTSNERKNQKRSNYDNQNATIRSYSQKIQILEEFLINYQLAKQENDFAKQKIHKLQQLQKLIIVTEKEIEQLKKELSKSTGLFDLLVDLVLLIYNTVIEIINTQDSIFLIGKRIQIVKKQKLVAKSNQSLKAIIQQTLESIEFFSSKMKQVHEFQIKQYPDIKKFEDILKFYKPGQQSDD